MTPSLELNTETSDSDSEADTDHGLDPTVSVTGSQADSEPAARLGARLAGPSR